ncbi:hypothetical protein JD969_03735 [Planctomycetota bacterium]|nr:hypothetical protein JD969_03735 [Planctomycetota bacterium]
MGNRYFRKTVILQFMLLFSALVNTGPLFAETDVNDHEIELKFAPNIELRFLVDYVSQQLKIDILYDESINNKRITLQTHGKVKKGQLLDLLNNILEIKGLVLVEDESGWRRIVPAKNFDKYTLARVSNDTQDQFDSSFDIVTLYSKLDHTEASKLQGLVSPLLTQPGGSIHILNDQNVLVVTDYVKIIDKVQKLLEMADRPSKEIEHRFFEIKFANLSELSRDLTQILSSQKRLQDKGSQQSDNVIVMPCVRLNYLLVLGEAKYVQEVESYIHALDRELPGSTQVYHLKYKKPSKILKIVESSLRVGDNDKYILNIVPDDDSRSLIVTATEYMHVKINKIVNHLDVLTQTPQTIIHSYKLSFADAKEVLSTIQQLENKNLGLSNFKDDLKKNFNEKQNDIENNDLLHPDTITVTADINTNSIIVIGSSQIHEVYSQLIKLLDKRRPQVLIECTIVTLDENDSETLGVELGGDIEFGDSITSKLFTSFGLSAYDAETGVRTVGASTGFNGTLVKTDVVDVLVKALVKKGNSRILAMPRLLVNDNATGKINSVNEAPTTSINSDNGVSNSGFGGYEEAGTQISVTPHIAEGDHLRLEYNITLNSFTGEGSGGNPPPRQTNEVSSEVTVPDGYTIIVGGVKRIDQSEGKSAVPILGELPVLEYLFGSRENKHSESVMYVFIRPIILRDDDFSDLKYFSNRSLGQANMDASYPVSEPLLMP